MAGGRPAGARGAAAVEFALIVPILMVLVVGIINYGDMLSVRQSVSQAAAEGARAAAVTPGAEAVKKSAATSAVATALGAQNQTCNSSCTVYIDDCDLAAGVSADTTNGPTTPDCAYVKVTIAYEAMVPGFGLILPDTLTYTAVARVS